MLRFFSCVDNLLAIVVATGLANAVSEIVFTAVRTLYHAGHFELPNIGTSLVTSCLRCFSLRYSHFKTSLGIILMVLLTHYSLLYHTYS